MNQNPKTGGRYVHDPATGQPVPRAEWEARQKQPAAPAPETPPPAPVDPGPAPAAEPDPAPEPQAGPDPARKTRNKPEQ